MRASAASILISITLLAILRHTDVDAQPPRAHFTDVAPQSRFNYVTRNDYRDRKYFIQPMCGGVAILDYDNDGKLDIFFTNGAELPSMKKSASFSNSLLRNRGAGIFEDRTSAAGVAGGDVGYTIGAASGDYDNDGYTDLFLANARSNTLLHNNRDGTFTDVTAGSGISKPANTLSVAAAWFDYDNDRLPDLVVSDYTIWTPDTDYRCTDSLKRESYCSPTRYVSVPNRLYHNLGNGKFEDVTEQSGLGQARGKGMGVSITDVNNDGQPDNFIVNDTERNFSLSIRAAAASRNRESFTASLLTTMGLPSMGWGRTQKTLTTTVSWTFFITISRRRYSRFLPAIAGSSSGMSATQPVSGAFPMGSAAGAPASSTMTTTGGKTFIPLMVTWTIWATMRNNRTMFRNLAGKSFADVSATMGVAFTRKGFHRGSAFADLNNDGSLDIVVTGINERPRILINAGTPGAHWLLLDLQGTHGNRDAIGVKIKVTTASGRMLHNHVSVSTGFMSSSDRRVHFGLGAERAIASVEIRWPSGQVQTLSDVTVDQILRVREPD